ncbi:MAG: type 4a pilus biogenesis protein PilO [Pirellulales bacterium]|nr:type 4a pilus biogenesis protein PilO [Pirellulales bacterium]
MIRNLTNNQALRLWSGCLHAAGASVALLILWFASWCQHMIHTQYEQRAAHATELRELLQRSGKLNAHTKKLERELAAAQDGLAAIHERLAPVAAEAEFLGYLSELALATQVNIKEFRPGRVVGTTHNSALELQIRAQGTFAEICHFLDGISRLPRMCYVSNLSINEPPQPRGDCNIEIQLRFPVAGNLPLVSPNRKLALKSQ